MKHFEHQIDTTAKKDSCSKCHAPTWTLWVMGMLTTLDVDPLDLLGEIQAKLAGRRTYQIRRHDEGFRASLRTQHNIQPDDHNTKTILALHECQTDTMIATGHPNYFPSRYTQEIPERPAF